MFFLKNFQFTLGNVDCHQLLIYGHPGHPVSRATFSHRVSLHLIVCPLHRILFPLHYVSTPSYFHPIVCPLYCVSTTLCVHFVVYTLYPIVNALHLVYPASLLSLLFLFTRPLTWLGTPFLVSSVGALAFTLAFFSP